MVTRKERFQRQFEQSGVSIPTSEKLAGVAETTAVRRGRVEPLEVVAQPIQAPSNIIAPPPSPVQQAVQPIHVEPVLTTPVVPYCGEGKQYNQVSKRCEVIPQAVCGGKKPYAQEVGGRTFCTEADFLAVYQPKSPKVAVTVKCPTGYYLDTRYGTGVDSYGRPTGKCRPDLFGQYGQAYKAEKGFHGYIDKPTNILVGESGRERVDITPVEKENNIFKINTDFDYGFSLKKPKTKKGQRKHLRDSYETSFI